MFLAAESYRGRLTVSTIRLFGNEMDAWKHVKKFVDSRVYDVSSAKKPILCKQSKQPKQPKKTKE